MPRHSYSFQHCIALGRPRSAHAYVGFGLNLAVPLYYPAPARPATVVYQAPAQAVADQVTASPGPGYVWMAGHWSFYGQKWVWVAGHWELPPSPSAIWVARPLGPGKHRLGLGRRGLDRGRPPVAAPGRADASRRGPRLGPGPAGGPIGRPARPAGRGARRRHRLLPPPRPMADGTVVGRRAPGPDRRIRPRLPLSGLCLDRRILGLERGLVLERRPLRPSAVQGRRLGFRRLGPRGPRLDLAGRPLALSGPPGPIAPRAPVF